MTPADFNALRETQRRLGAEQDEMREALERFEEGLLDNTKETLRVGRSLEENTATTKRTEEKVDAVLVDIAGLIAAFRSAATVYRVGAWVGKVVKDWAWLPGGAIVVLGTIKGWWKQLWP